MKRAMSILTIALLMLSFMPVNIQVKASNQGTTYYVDSLEGNDNNPGTSENKAWKTIDKVNNTTFEPGDKLLLRANSIWTGQLWPKGSGAEGAPIIIDRYGEGSKPIINGEGKAGQVDDADPNKTVNATLYLYNQEYWEINNLELTNDSDTSSRRRGVWIVGEDIGTLNHIYLKGLSVHNVNGDGKKDSGGSAGILFDIKATGQLSNYNDILIENNEVYTVNRTGIGTASSWWKRPEVGAGGPYNYKEHTNVIIRGNSLRDIGGDGIVPINTMAALVEHNTVSEANARSDYYTANAGVWAWNGDDNVFQYNEVYDTKYGKDSQAYDIDYAQSRTIFQYNYSHDNEGGFILICADGSGINEDGIVRYNISQNDQRNIFSFGGTPNRTKIYNNTIYLGPDSDVNILWTEAWGGWATNTTFENNIFYNLGSGGYVYGQAKDTVFDNNLFYGNHPKSEPDDPNKMTENPLLAGPGTGDLGIDSVDGYKLFKNSPAIGTGKVIPNNGGEDYWGNEVSATERPNVGAYNGSGVEPAPIEDIQLENSKLMIYENETVNMPVRFTPEIGVDTSFVIENSDESIVDAQKDGSNVIITGVSEGKAEVTIKTPDGSKQDVVTISVKKEVAREGNLLANPGFEEGMKSWINWPANTSDVVKENARSGEFAGRLGLNKSSAAGFEQVVTGLSSNTTYLLTAYGKVIKDGDRMTIGVKNFDAKNNTIDTVIDSTDFAKSQVIFTTGSNSQKAHVLAWREAGNQYAFVDDYQLTPLVTEVVTEVNDIELVVGEEKAVAVHVLPAISPNKEFQVNLDKPEVGKVKVEGNELVIEANSPGQAQATITSLDGGKQTTININVSDSLEPGIDVTPLEDLIKQAREVSNEDQTYTDQSYFSLQAAIEEAETVLSNIKNEDELTDAVALLKAAIDRLLLVKELDTAYLQSILEEHKGSFSEKDYRSLTLHLTAVGQFENKGVAEKVIKHLESFKRLLDYQLEKDSISQNLYKILKSNANSLIKKCEVQ